MDKKHSSFLKLRDSRNHSFRYSKFSLFQNICIVAIVTSQTINVNFNCLQIPDDVVEEVDQCNEQLRLKDGELLSILKRLATIVTDEEYMAELLAINNKVVQLSAGH